TPRQVSGLAGPGTPVRSTRAASVGGAPRPPDPGGDDLVVVRSQEGEFGVSPPRPAYRPARERRDLLPSPHDRDRTHRPAEFLRDHPIVVGAEGFQSPRRPPAAALPPVRRAEPEPPGGLGLLVEFLVGPRLRPDPGGAIQPRRPDRPAA